MQTVVIGRDGVINRNVKGGVNNAADWNAIPGSLRAIAKLNHSGYRVAVATNQPEIELGTMDLATLGSIHHKMYEQLARAGGHLDGAFFCPHSEETNCDCRIPRSGLLEDIARRFGIDPRSLTVIGNTVEDTLAAQSVTARMLFINVTANGVVNELAGVPNYPNLNTAVENLILEDSR